MDFRVLGSLEVWAGNDRIMVPVGRQQRVLAALLLSPNKVTSLDRLVTVLWDDDPPTTAIKQVRNCVSALRERLGGSRGCIVTDGLGYRVILGVPELDMLRFHRDLAEARSHATDGDHRAAVTAVRNALRWWRGPALDGLDSAALAGLVARLNEQRLHAVESCADWQLEVGDHWAVVEELTEVVAQHPLREATHARLMLALGRGGRQADALAVFHALRTRLVEELGIEPGRELHNAYARTLATTPPATPPRTGPSPRRLDQPMYRAMRDLATAVHRRWTADARVQPQPSALTWTYRPAVGTPVSSTGGGRADSSQSEPRWRAGTATEIVVAFRATRHRQLVILGEPSADKSALGIALTLGLLDGRDPDEPVPVPVAVASWNPRDEDLNHWLANALIHYCPGLADSAGYGPDAATRLVVDGRIVPILHGLDEMPAARRADTIDALDQAVAAGYPLVLTCRTADYERTATTAGSLATRAATIEIESAVRSTTAGPGPSLRPDHPAIGHVAAPPTEPNSEATWVGLRPHLTRLVGRAAESAHLAALLTRERMITVTGAGGCGKTALAVTVAYEATCRRRIPGCMLALATVASAEQAVHALAELAGTGGDGEDVDGALVAVERTLATGPRLLVLDNCEHLAGGVADLVTRLLGGCSELVVLATSRQPLGVPGEIVLALEPLPVPAPDAPEQAVLAAPSVELFIERVRQAAPAVSIMGGSVDQVAELCRRLDGLPLALELVAARARVFPLRELTDRVGHDLTLLFRTSSGGDPRHTTLEAALDWSFRLLPTDQRYLFARLSVFAGGFTAVDAEAVCGFAPLRASTVAAQLAALVDRSLVQPYDLAGTRRYRLLNVIRTYAGARLADLGERTVTARHHLGRWLAIARDIDRLPRYHDRVLRLQAMEPDAANLRQCLDFGLGAGHGLDAAEIVAKTFEFWQVNKGYLTEGRVWLRRMLALPDLHRRPDIHALLRFHRALVAKMVGDALHGLALMCPVIDELAQRRPREHLEAQACVLNSKMVALDPSVLDDVEPAVAAALASTEVDDARTVINAAGSTLNTWGRYQRTVELGAAYDRRNVQLGPSSMAAKLTVRIEALVGLGDLARAAALIDDLLGLLGSIAHAAEHASPRRVIATYYLASQRPDRARPLLDEALITLSAANPPLTSRLVTLQIMLAEVRRQCGDLTGALSALREGLAAAKDADGKHSFAAPLCAALLAADLGDTESAAQLITGWEEVRHTHGLPIPAGFVVAAGTLGLDPAPSDQPIRRWDPAALVACLDSVRTWCAQPMLVRRPE